MTDDTSPPALRPEIELRVNFDVPKSSLLKGGAPNEFKMSNSETLFSRLHERRTGSPLELPDARNLEIC